MISKEQELEYKKKAIIDMAKGYGYAYLKLTPKTRLNFVKDGIRVDVYFKSLNCLVLRIHTDTIILSNDSLYGLQSIFREPLLDRKGNEVANYKKFL